MNLRLGWLTPILLIAACSATRLGDSVEQDLTDTLLSQKPAIATCYAEALARDETTQGRMILVAEVGKQSGEFENVSVVTSTLKDGELEACAVQQARKLQLDEPSGTRIAVTYPLVFEPTK